MAQSALNRDRREYVLPGTGALPPSYQTFDRVDTLVFWGMHSRHVSLIGLDGHGIRMGFGHFLRIAF